MTRCTPSGEEAPWVADYRGDDCGPHDPDAVEPGDVVRIWFFVDTLDERVVACGSWGFMVEGISARHRPAMFDWDRLVGIVRKGTQ